MDTNILRCVFSLLWTPGSIQIPALVPAWFRLVPPGSSIKMFVLSVEE